MIGSYFDDIPIRAASPAKKFRKGTPKSRNGCITCKIRRIKCDEIKPCCGRCSSTGRKCDGYIDLQAKENRHIVIAAAPPCNPYLDFPGTDQEHRFLAFFYDYTAPILSGCFDSEFWNILLPQVGHSEPTIQHAMIAVAAVHARIDSIDGLLHEEDKLKESRRFELQQYNKAISHLRRHLSANGVTIEVTLMCCVLLICLEFLQGSIEQAIVHLQGGINILQRYHTIANSESTTHASLHVSSSSIVISRKLEEIFHRLRNQWILCSRSAALEDMKLGSDQHVFKASFSSLEEARTSLDQLNTLGLELIHAASASLYNASAGDASFNCEEEISVTHNWLCSEFDRWSIAFESFLAQNTSVTDPHFSSGSTLLRMFYVTGKIWISTCISPTEAAFDDQIHEFSTIVALASSLLSSPFSYIGPLPKLSTKGRLSFTFEMGVIAPLYFTALKCRNRKLRSKAISLLSSCMPRREGFWDADILVYISRRVVEIEEARLDECIRPSANEATTTETPMPTEDDRLFTVIVRHENDHQHQGRKYSSVIYVKKPVDGSQDMLFYQEDIVQLSGTNYKKIRESRFTDSVENISGWATAAFDI